MAERKGKALETLVEHLERLANKDENISIRKNAELPDKITGESREFDVLMEMKSAHHCVTLGFECRDRKRPVGGPDIEQFAAKCEDTGIDQGIVVSSTGFNSPAIEKANRRGIRCLELAELPGVEWIEPGEFKNAGYIVHHQDIRIIPKDRSLLRASADIPAPKFTLHNASGERISIESISQRIRQIFIQKLKSSNPKQGTAEKSVSIRFQEPLFFALETSDKWHEIDGFLSNIKYEIREESSSFSIRRYSDPTTGETINELAYAPISVDGRAASLVMVRDRDEGTDISIVFKDLSKIKTRK